MVIKKLLHNCYSPGLQAKGVLDPPYHLFPLLFMGSPPLSPMVDIWGINLKGRKVPPAHPDSSYGPGVLSHIGPFGGASHHMPLNFNSESNHEVKLLGWEAKREENTTAVLVLEAPYTIKHMVFYDFI